MLSRLTSACSHPSLCPKDGDNHQLLRVSGITKGPLSSTRSAEITELALLINKFFRDASSSGFHCSTSNIQLVHWWKLGSSQEILLDRVYYPYAHGRSWHVLWIVTISSHHTRFFHFLHTSSAPHLYFWWVTFKRHQFCHFQIDSAHTPPASDPKATDLTWSTWSYSPPTYAHNQNMGYDAR